MGDEYAVNKRIKKLIAHKKKHDNMLLEEFARIAGDLSECYFSSIQNNRKKATKQVIKAIVTGHGVNEEWLLHGKGDMINTEKLAVKPLYYNIKNFICENINIYKDILDLDEKYAEIYADLKNESFKIADFFTEWKSPHKFFRNSDKEPNDILNSIINYYISIESFLNKILEIIYNLREPNKDSLEKYYREFYEKDKKEIEEIEIKIKKYIDIAKNRINFLEKNKDNKKLLNVDSYFIDLIERRTGYKNLPYKDILDIMLYIDDKIKSEQKRQSDKK